MYFYTKRGGMSGFCRGITDASVVNGLQFFAQHGLGIGDVAEGDGALAEKAFGHHAVDKPVYKFAY